MDFFRYRFSIISIWILLAVQLCLAGKAWYVSPTSNPGLQAMLSSESPVQAGDTLYLEPGVYSGSYESVLNGQKNAPIVIRPLTMQRTTLDGAGGTEDQALFLKGSWIEIYDLEITNSNPDRTQKSDGVRFEAMDSKMIHCVIHDNAQGIGFWSSAVNSELYGNIIFNNGYEAADRGHGHGIYTQNATGTKRIRDNTLFFGYGFGIQAYTEKGSIQGFEFQRNAWFRTGNSVAGSSIVGETDGLLIGGLQPVDRALLQENYSWVPDPGARSVRFGWSGSVENISIEIRDNYFVGTAITQGTWKSAIVDNNDFFATAISPQPADFPNNRFSVTLPTVNKQILHPSEYNAAKIRIILYNWEERDCFDLTLANQLSVGDSFSIQSVFDLYGNPVLAGRYSGVNPCVPMGAVAAPQPQGAPDAISGSDDPGKMFGVFILTRNPQRAVSTAQKEIQRNPGLRFRRTHHGDLEIRSAVLMEELRMVSLNGTQLESRWVQGKELIIPRIQYPGPFLIGIRTQHGDWVTRIVY